MHFDIHSMLHPEVYQHPVQSLELIETHISWVILTGEFAYKIKKPVNFGFLDFSTLEKRRFCCEEELRLNRRLAPEIYLEVVKICGTVSSPVMSADNEAFEYAVKMKQFPQSAQLDNMLKAGKLTQEHIDRIAEMVAVFHQQINIAAPSTEYGNPQAVMHPVLENLQQIEQHIDTHLFTESLAHLRQWVDTEFGRKQNYLELRKQQGFIRECHGDMHLRNMLWLDDEPQAFDCIEFNPDLRWIDVISELAFLVMDLQDRSQNKLANRCLNRYLQNTGDYASLSLLAFYQCYRALVRAKVDALRLEQGDFSKDESQLLLKEFTSYIDLASSYTQTGSVKLIIMRGLSASGKSTFSQQLVDTIGAIRIRSDVERKRLFNIEPTEHLKTDLNRELYSKDATQKTYDRLLELAETIIIAGYSVVVDATFLTRAQRKPFEQLAQKLKIPYFILQMNAPIDILRERIIARKETISDADIEVLEYQFANWMPVEEEEQTALISVETSTDIDVQAIVHALE